jgi:uncharacterized protein YcaQ
VCRTVARLGAVQIDSVNVLVRSHYLPCFSRLGPYAVAKLDRAAYTGRGRALFEYWGHEASLMPVALQPLFRWRMEHARRGQGTWSRVSQFGRERRDFIAGVLAQVRARGPLRASELDGGGRSRGAWWGWSDGKAALEWLFWVGEVTTATRRGFERVYDVPERVLPAAVLAVPTPSEADAQRALVARASRALGIAAERDLRDYFRLTLAAARARIAELCEAGTLRRVTVEGWARPVYLDAAARLPRQMDACALLSPFDSLVWDRARTERLFAFRYRLALYTPPEERAHGYYVLPFLLGDRLVARVDLKAERASGTLRVLGAQAEPGVERADVAGPLRGELERMATWLDLGRLRVERRGGLAGLLRQRHDAAT